jgi:hypothetical protein
MPRAGFEPEIPMFERPKTVLALDRSAIETGSNISTVTKNKTEQVNVKGKVRVLNEAPCHEDVLVKRRYSSAHSMTSVLDGGE